MQVITLHYIANKLRDSKHEIINIDHATFPLISINHLRRKERKGKKVTYIYIYVLENFIRLKNIRYVKNIKEKYKK